MSPINRQFSNMGLLVRPNFFFFYFVVLLWRLSVNKGPEPTFMFCFFVLFCFRMTIPAAQT